MANERNTIQKALILGAVKKMRCHASADEIYGEVAKEHPGISKGTVYRNLNRLSETGEIGKVEIPDGPDRFDRRQDRHYHVRCGRCGRIFDVDMDYIPDLETNIRDSHGFSFSGHSILFEGICPECGGTETE